MRLSAWLSLLLVAPALAGCLQIPDSLDTAREGGRSGGAGAPGGAAPAAEWPALADAPLRPGVQIVSPTGQCTSNFVFTSVDNRSVYFGLAAHCVDGLDMGTPMEIDNGRATGTLAYSSWATMDEVEEADAMAREYNDFALVRVDDEHRALVHPAMRHFGGPVALADTSQVK
jgi:hypothetical protein